ncbi:hypothetical protein GCM10018952_00020 [Streptosporangium vulgare]
MTASATRAAPVTVPEGTFARVSVSGVPVPVSASASISASISMSASMSASMSVAVFAVGFARAPVVTSAGEGA